jgi:4-hydroxy-tetrahydrodipicolinate reductase
MMKRRDDPIRVCVVGGLGRMGKLVIDAVNANREMTVYSVLSDQVGIPINDFIVTEDPNKALNNVEVVIDFSAPSGCASTLPICVEKRIPYLLASTGLSSAEQGIVDSASASVAMIQTSNCSLGVTVLMELVELASKRLEDFDAEIFEIHHKHKRDAPSGTARSLGEAVSAGRGELQEVVGRSGMSEPRAKNELGYAAMRGGDVSGDHTVFFFGDNERIELTHRSTSPTIFSAGAVRAAHWLVGKSPGKYSMGDVLMGDV